MFFESKKCIQHLKVKYFKSYVIYESNPSYYKILIMIFNDVWINFALIS
jgi:hypothetical protein